MENKMKVFKSFSRFQDQKVGLMLALCFVVSMSFLALSKPFDQLTPKLQLNGDQTNLKAELAWVKGDVDVDVHKGEDSRLKNVEEKENIKDGATRNSTTISPVSRDAHISQHLGVMDEEIKLKKGIPTTLDSAYTNNTTLYSKEDVRGEYESTKIKPLCDISDKRSEICEIAGEIRIHGNSSTVTLISERNESYRIRPYARKGDEGAMGHIRQVFVRSNNKGSESRCTVNHTIPAIVFATNGYIGNLFHDFTDLLIPLFVTSHEFNREVQFLITNLNPWWVYKYQLVLGNLSKYPIIDFDKDNQVHCYARAIIGLKCHKELSIDPQRAPNNYSMHDFAKFMRSTYTLERDMIRPSQNKPRLLIISRKRTRAFTNVDEIVRLAEELGYEAVIAEPQIGSNVGQFARIVNSCDVMMGVHGAGLTNMVYLPTNAAIIQVVPWGGLGWVARFDFEYAARDLGLNYLHYEISMEESSLIEEYPRDNPIFKDPFSYHKKGWDLMRNTFLRANVRLDVKRFRATLLEALTLVLRRREHIH